MFAPLLTLPKDPAEARLVAEALDGAARALREWPQEAWAQVGQRSEADATPLAGGSADGLLERLVHHVAPVAVDPRRRQEAIRAAEAVGDVLRVLWKAEHQGTATPEARELAIAA